MGKFIPSEHVEKLEYDFTEYGGSAGVIQEPSTGRVNGFFKSMKGLVREVSKMQKDVADIQVEELSDEELAERMASVDEDEGTAAIYQKRSVEYLAELCGAERVFRAVEGSESGEQEEVVVGGSPSVADLDGLPFRVLQAFTAWLMEEIKPKRTTPGTKP